MQRTFRDGFYTRPLPARRASIQTELNEYLDYYNRRRPHRALNGLAPLEYLAMMQAVNTATGELLGKLVEELVPQDGEFWMCWLITKI